MSHEIGHLEQPSRLAVDEQRDLHEPIQPSQPAPADAGVSPFRHQGLEDPLVLRLVGDHDAELLAVLPAHSIEHGSKAQEQLFEDALEWVGRRHREWGSCDRQQPEAGIDGWERPQQRGQTVQEVEPDRPRHLAPGTPSRRHRGRMDLQLPVRRIEHLGHEVIHPGSKPLDRALVDGEPTNGDVL
ncbi:MAG TPA: hypothetical protein VFD49_20475 [Candidatus Dormibacteraeota bacterium]|nr:hypothetical protein [Candidatus Dormibacteraeota bacterium]